jgi:hypothetical protein
MNQNLLLSAAAGLGVIVGAGGTWLTVSNTANGGEAVSQATIVAAIKADPSLCPMPETPTPAAVETAPELTIPTKDEAVAAFRKAKPSFPSATIELGDCDKNTMGPGVSCAVQIVWKPGGQPQSGVVGFAKTGAGWQAMHYY